MPDARFISAVFLEKGAVWVVLNTTSVGVGIVGLCMRVLSHNYHNGTQAHVIFLSLIASSAPRHLKHAKPKTLSDSALRSKSNIRP